MRTRVHIRLLQRLIFVISASTVFIRPANAQTGSDSIRVVKGSYALWSCRTVYAKTKGKINQTESELQLNPAVRFSFSAGHYQAIPGVGAPVCIVGKSTITAGAFLYLSIEPF